MYSVINWKQTLANWDLDVKNKYEQNFLIEPLETLPD